jgi:hypothetical protein
MASCGRLVFTGGGSEWRGPGGFRTECWEQESGWVRLGVDGLPKLGLR